MKTTLIIILITAINFYGIGQKNEVKLKSTIEKVTVFFQGAQLSREQSTNLKPGRQFVVFEKLTDFLDPNSVQVKASGDLTILNVRTRKNFEDLKMSTSEIKELTGKRKNLEKKEEALTNEYQILSLDKGLLMKNRELRGNTNGLSVSELKLAYEFMHVKLTEISTRQSAIESELEQLFKEINRIDQEIISQRSKPVVNYTEVVIEVDVAKSTNAKFLINYISPNAQWTPYYDMRSNGIGEPVKLQAKALVNQNTGIEWNKVNLVLSTNDPYQNTKEPDLNPWYIQYYNQPRQRTQYIPQIPEYDYSGETLQGEVIDATTGEPMPFTQITFPGYPNVGTVTDFDGKFKIVVPKNAKTVRTKFIGYNSANLRITAPYLKFFIYPGKAELKEMIDEVERETLSSSEVISLEEMKSVSIRGHRKGKKNADYSKGRDEYTTGTSGDYDATTVATTVTQKDLRVEYTIQSKFTIPSNGVDQRVSITEHEMTADYEYHSVPKLDPSVYLVANITGWEKLNLLNGQSNLYFDGTYIGKTYVDANSLKDTLTFSLGKDSKIQIERKRIIEKSSSKLLGSRRKFEVTWEIGVKNNGGASIPLIIKDQFPISTDKDIKIKYGDYSSGKLNDKTKIITWRTLLSSGQKINYLFDYKVDYNNSLPLNLE